MFPLPNDFEEARSGLLGGLLLFFREPPVKTSLIFAPGDMPRPFRDPAASDVLRDLSISRESSVAAFRGARFVIGDVVTELTESGKVVDFWYPGGWKAGSSRWETVDGSTALDLINGDEEVR